MKRTHVYLIYLAVVVTALVLQVPLFGHSHGEPIMWIFKFALACVVSFIFYAALVVTVFALRRYPHSVRRIKRLREEERELQTKLREDIQEMTKGKSP